MLRIWGLLGCFFWGREGPSTDGRKKDSQSGEKAMLQGTAVPLSMALEGGGIPLSAVSGLPANAISRRAEARRRALIGQHALFIIPGA